MSERVSERTIKRCRSTEVSESCTEEVRCCRSARCGRAGEWQSCCLNPGKVMCQARRLGFHLLARGERLKQFDQQSDMDLYVFKCFIVDFSTIYKSRETRLNGPLCPHHPASTAKSSLPVLFHLAIHIFFHFGWSILFYFFLFICCFIFF